MTTKTTTIFGGDINLAGKINGNSLPTTQGTLVTTAQIPSLADYVDKSTDQLIGGTKSFANDVTMKSNLRMDGLINGSTFPDDAGILAVIDRDQIITGINTFENNVIMNNNLTVSGVINGCKFPVTPGTLATTTQIPSLADYIDNNSDQLIGGAKTFENDVTMKNNINLTEGTINGCTFPDPPGILAIAAQIPTNYVTSDSEQTITAPKTFSSDVNIDSNLRVSGMINENTFPEIPGTLATIAYVENNFVDVSTSQSISGTKIFDGPIVIKGTLKVNGNINGSNRLVEPDTLMTRAMTTTDFVSIATQQNITAEKYFMKKVTIVADLIVNGTINGNAFPETAGTLATTTQLSDYVDKTTAQTITGTKAFSDGVSFLTTGGTASTLNYYEEGTLTYNVTGVVTSAVSARFVRIGKQITLNVNTFTTTSNSNVSAMVFTPTTPMSRLNPIRGVGYFSVFCYNAGVMVPATLVLTSEDGKFTLTPTGTTFSTNVMVGITPINITYFAAT